MATETLVMRTRPRSGMAWRRILNPPAVVTLIVLIAAWQVAVQSGALALDYLPAPTGVAAAFVDAFASGAMVRDLSHTLSSALTGWAVGGLAGLVLGAGIGLSLHAWRWSMASVDLLRSIPAITFVPVAALLFGFSLQMELVVTIYAALWPVLVNTAIGVRGVPLALVETARTLRLPRMRRLWSIELPAAAGSIVVGLRLGLSLGLTLAVAAEVVGNPRGAGYAIITRQQALDPEGMFAYIVAIGLCGLALNALLALGIRILVPGIARTLREGDA